MHCFLCHSTYFKNIYIHTVQFIDQHSIHYSVSCSLCSIYSGWSQDPFVNNPTHARSGNLCMETSRGTPIALGSVKANWPTICSSAAHHNLDAPSKFSQLWNSIGSAINCTNTCTASKGQPDKRSKVRWNAANDSRMQNSKSKLDPKQSEFFPIGNTKTKAGLSASTVICWQSSRVGDSTTLVGHTAPSFQSRMQRLFREAGVYIVILESNHEASLSGLKRPLKTCCNMLHFFSPNLRSTPF